MSTLANTSPDACPRTLSDRAFLAVRIGLGVLLLLSLIVSIMSLGNAVFWFESIRTQIRFKNGFVEWWIGWKNHGISSPFPPTLAFAVLLVSSLFYRRLQSAGGLILLTALVNTFAYGLAECELAVPTAFLFDVLLLSVMVRSIAKPKLLAPGVCHVCGYDLRATPEQCPECGTKVFLILKS